MRIIIYLFILAIGFSCKTPRYIYSPAPPNAPYFKKKGDSKLSGWYSDAGGSTINGNKGKDKGYDIQTAYAISNHCALTGSYFYRSEKDIYPLRYNNIFDSSIVNYTRKLIDIGGGYFAKIENKRSSDECTTFGIYSGLGFGKFTINDNGVDKNGVIYSRFYSNNIVKYYLQMGLNVMLLKSFFFSVTPRLSFVHYYKTTTSYSNYEMDYFYLNRINDKTIIFFESTFAINAGVPGLDWCRADAGLNFSSTPPGQFPAARAVNFFTGLTFDLSKLKKVK